MLILYNFHISWNIFIFLFSTKLIKIVKTILTIQKQTVNWVWPMGHSLQTLCLLSSWDTKAPLLWPHLLFLSPLLTALQPLFCPANYQAFSCLWAIAFALLLPETSCPLDVSMANFLHNYFGSQLKCQVITEAFPDTPISQWASHPQASPTQAMDQYSLVRCH